MFKRIVVPIDGSSCAQAAVEYAARLAAKFDGRIELLHVIDWRLLAGHFITHFTEIFHREGEEGFVTRVERYYRGYGERLLEGARQRVLSFGVSDCVTAIETGKVAKHIIERADGAHLVVIGQRGETAEVENETNILGSVVERVLTDLETTVLVVQPPVREWLHALLAYDGTTRAKHALEALEELAVAFKFDVQIVHLMEPNKDPASLKEAEEQLARLPISYEVHYLNGGTHALILDYAAKKDCDLLSMGAFAHRLWGEHSLGTTTEGMLRQSQIPVLVHR